MVSQATIDMLVGMKMTAMAAELSSQLQDSSFNELGFEDRLGLLVTAEWNRRQTNTVKRLIHNAHFAAPSAAVVFLSTRKTAIFITSFLGLRGILESRFRRFWYCSMPLLFSCLKRRMAQGFLPAYLSTLTDVFRVLLPGQ